jgi:hypothetical protein
MTVRSTLSLICLLALSLAAAGCASQAAVPDADLQESPLVAFSPLPTATPNFTATPVPTEPPPAPTATQMPTSTPTATLAPALGSMELVILHTNDNWGETEPCG